MILWFVTSLTPFTPDEVAQYISFKLASAGYGSVLPVSPADLMTIHDRSNGVPGAVNMLAVTQLNKAVIKESQKRKAAQSNTEKRVSLMPLPSLAKYLGAAGVLGLALFVAVSFTGGDGGTELQNPQSAEVDSDNGGSRCRLVP